MAAPQHHDPFRTFSFRVELAGLTVAAFTEVSGLESEAEVIEYREGGDGRVRFLYQYLSGGLSLVTTPAACAPSCGGKTCGPDGCGGSCDRIGDLLTSSSKAGYAMRCANRVTCSGEIIGGRYRSDHAAA